jgi:hypothetical protein
MRRCRTTTLHQTRAAQAVKLDAVGLQRPVQVSFLFGLGVGYGYIRWPFHPGDCTVLAASALAWGLFIPLADDGAVLPHAAVLRVRLLLLHQGMDQDQVEAVLHLRNLRNRLLLRWAGGNLRWHSEEYDIAPAHRLRLDYRHDERRDKWVLSGAALEREGVGGLAEDRGGANSAHKCQGGYWRGLLSRPGATVGICPIDALEG